MCGISGYIGSREAMPIIFSSLRCLEYRGYDSSGIAVWDGRRMNVRKAVGNLDHLQLQLRKKPLHGNLGIGHTRWATHGEPSDINAHPHSTEEVSVVHNGIIENYVELRRQIARAGRKLKSQTDTEVIAHLMQIALDRGLSPFSAFKRTLSKLEGSFALIVMCTRSPDRLFFARTGSPLLVGLGDGEKWIASDIPALLESTKQIIELEDGDVGFVTKREYSIFGMDGKKRSRAVKIINYSSSIAQKGGYKHFMLKEIFEQPIAVQETLRGRIICPEGRIELNGVQTKLERTFDKLTQITIVACGTSYHAALAGEYIFGEMCHLPVVVETASEFRYRKHFTDPNGMVIAISQSGETADTLAALRLAKKQKIPVFAISNIMGSSIVREADASILTRAGIEIGVASTKAFTTQLTVLGLLGLYLSREKKILTHKDFCACVQRLLQLPRMMRSVLKHSDDIGRIASRFVKSEGFLFLGRGINFPIALEGALKLKEISYQWAEGYPAGEMKHGPIALIDRGTPVLVIATNDDATYQKTISNIEEVRARHASVIAIATEGDKQIKHLADHVITIPKTAWFLTPILSAVVMQLFAYHLANKRGKSIDQPRNLAKSVTVE